MSIKKINCKDKSKDSDEEYSRLKATSGSENAQNQIITAVAAANYLQ
jgi:hypothetical protein